MSAVSISLKSIAAHERSHKGELELAKVIEHAADRIEFYEIALSEIIELDHKNQGPESEATKIARAALSR